MKSKGLHFRYLLIVLVIAVICLAILFKMSRTIFVEREEWQAKAGFCGRWFQSGYIQPLPRPALPGFGTDARRSYGRRI